MSTRSSIWFWGGDLEPSAGVYVHSDGYPEGENGRLEDLERFFTAAEIQTTDTRFYDPEYLAARYLVFKAREFAKDPARRPLNFLSVGVTLNPHMDEEYRYSVLCHRPRPDGRPTVLWQPVDFDSTDLPFPDLDTSDV